MDTSSRNLVLVYDRRHMDPQDFIEIAELVRRRAPDIGVFVVDSQVKDDATAREVAERPSLVMCPFPLAKFTPIGGKVYQGRWMGKIRQLERFDETGIPTPKWAVVDTSTQLDGATWGPAVVIKPEFGRRGRGIRLVPTQQVGYHAAMMRLAGHQGPSRRLYAQKFVDTGDPNSFYRVLSFFSQPLNCHFDTAPVPEELVDTRSLPVNGVEIAVNSAINRFSRQVCEPAILEFARCVHASLDQCPVLGIDIVRERDSGKLFVLEANPSGHVWHLSSSFGRRFQQQYGYNDYDQFEALSVVSDVLIQRTRSEAV